jgi:molybdopterin synthase sulfur carrier subunit
MSGFSVAIPTQLRSYTAGAAQVRVAVASTAPTLAEVLAALDAAHPGIRFRMVDETGHVRPHIQIFVNAKVERNPAATVPPNATVMIVGALSGG